MADAVSLFEVLLLKHRLAELGQLGGGILFDISMEAVTVRIHGHDRCEAVHLKMPHRLRNAKFHEVYGVDLLDTFCVILRRTADCIEVDRAVLPKALRVLGPIPPLPITARMPNFLIISP